MVKHARGAGIGTPLRYRHKAGLDQLKPVEQVHDLGMRAELCPPEPPSHLVLKGGRGRVLHVQQMVDHHVTSAR